MSMRYLVQLLFVVVAAVLLYWAGTHVRGGSAPRSALPVGRPPADKLLDDRVQAWADDLAPVLREVGAGLASGSAAAVDAVGGTLPGGVSEDAEWNALPRTDLDPGPWMATLGPGLSADPLFRNRHLNPADTYIPKPLRAELCLLFETMRGRLTSLDDAHRTIPYQEAIRLRSRVPSTLAMPKVETANGPGGAIEV